ncbi:hypothetical protein [Paenibacillus sp. Marseille-Q4541]|uniref:hypothetical protein n=1 Tax=Paenibacillus sp. Marseille-Q4541 TaxID=2831522 RepID=UPI001BAB62C5|nr:hypothetical protein [Paenibacillus sp. Marseille-Q4541]
MPKENSIRFNKVNIYLVFDVHGEHNDDSVNIEVSCGEDIEMYLNFYRDRNWSELFESEGYGGYDVDYAVFKGITVSCTDEHGNRFFAGNDFGRYGSATLNIKHLEEDNAKKLDEIRKILG